MPTFVRPLCIADLDQCVAVESAAFPAAEGASRDKIEYRLSTCPELCFGLFLESPDDAIPPPPPPPIKPDGEGTLVAHILATKSHSPLVTDRDMALPADWKRSPCAVADVGHQPTGKTVALHSLAVSPARQRGGLGKCLMTKYLEQMRRSGVVERISILTYARLVAYYQALGFEDLGNSSCTYGGVEWIDMTCRLV